MFVKKYPYVHQDDSNSCGIACLEMVIKYYKGYIPKSILAQYTHTSKNGTTAYHMIETLKHFGFSATGVSCDLNENLDIVYPCIAHVILDNTYLHYVVIYTINWKKQYVIIGDPASKIYKMKLDQFYQIYNHTLIILYPIQKIPTYHKPKSIVKYTLLIIRHQWKMFIPVCILSCIIFSVSMIGSFYISILLNTPYHFLMIAFFLFLLIEISKYICTYLRNMLMQRLSEKLSFMMTTTSFSRMMQLPYIQYHNLPSGDFMSRIHDIEQVQEVISQVAFTILFDGLLFILSILLLFILQPKSVIICLFLAVGYSILISHFRPKYQKQVLDLEQGNVKMYSYMLDYVRGFEFVKGLSITNSVIQRFHHMYQNYTNQVLKFHQVVEKEMLIRGILESVCYLCFLFFNFLFYTNGTLSIGLLFAYQLLFSYIMEPMKRLVDTDFLLQHAKRSFERIESLPLPTTPRTGIKAVIQSITFQNLCITTDTDIPILTNVDCHFHMGELILCKGASGSGKSTLFKCIKGYYSVEGSQLLINGASYQRYDEEYLQKQILYISQNETLIMGTLYDNITLGENVDVHKLQAIFQLCEIDKIVENQPLKYQMFIEENGSNLSGGERAKIILARTLLKPFHVLLIDEGFEQMDVNLERRILKQLQIRYSNSIIAIISHRTENMDLYDQVIELDHGKIVCKLERNDGHV